MTGIELFAIGSQAVTLGNVLSFASALTGVLGAFNQGNAAADMNEYNAKLREMQGAQEAENLRRENLLRLGAIKANAAKSGVVMEGTPLMVLAESAANAEVDALNAEWSAGQGATLDRMRAENARAEIPYRAGTSLLRGIGGFV